MQRFFKATWAQSKHIYCRLISYDKIYVLRVKKCPYYRPQRSWAKVIFSQVCVKNSVHGGGGEEGVCLSACWDTPPPMSRSPWEQTPPPSGSRHTPRTRHTPLDQAHPWTRHTPPDQAHPPPRGSRLQHTVNEQPVRILLECILVVYSLQKMKTN